MDPEFEYRRAASTVNGKRRNLEVTVFFFVTSLFFERKTAVQEGGFLARIVIQ